MITDRQTNFLYLSEKIQDREAFSSRLTGSLRRHNIQFDFLPSTKDIWAVDYMPIQVEPNRFIRFTYQPDYLNFKKYQPTITDTDRVCQKLGIPVVKSKIIIDGGNVIRGKNWVILTDKIFKENLGYKEIELIDELETLFQCRVIIIPRDPGDYTGHADGILRYYDENTVLINKYSMLYRKDFQISLRCALHNAGLKAIEIPYDPSNNRSNNEAHGHYINYLQMEDFVLLPTFNLDADDRNFHLFEQLFPGYVIEGIDSTEISKDGGVLNCISWNILK